MQVSVRIDNKPALKYNVFMKTSSKLNLTEKQNNIIKVLRVIFDNPEALTSDIKKATGLSVSTISRVINELKQKELIEISGKEKISKGRFPQILRFNFDSAYLVHIDITPSAIHGCIANLYGKIIDKQYKELFANELSLKTILAEIEDFYQALKGSRNVLAAGFSIPGVVNERKRKVSRIPDIEAFNDLDVFTLLEDTLSVPVIINNIPGILAMGEKMAHYQDCDNLVYLNIMQSIGIGAGIISNGRLVKGKNFVAGEVGDFYFDRKSFSSVPTQSVGRLEQYAGLRALYTRAQELIDNGGAKNLADAMRMQGVKKPSPCLIEQSIRMGDDDLKTLYIDIVRVWVILIIDIVLLLNPEEIVIGGAISSENTMTQNIINEMLSQELFVDQYVNLGKAGENTVYIGGLHMLKNFVFNKILIEKAIY